LSETQSKNCKTTHFGFTDVPWEKKQRNVNAVFRRVAKRYDLMNDVMSLGLHRLWKRVAIDYAAVRKDEVVLDLASGSGDLALSLARQLDGLGELIVVDINPSMLDIAKAKIANAGFFKAIRYLEANAEDLPLDDQSVDCVTLAFGLRNMTDFEAVFSSIKRVLRPGGRLIILEFSKMTKGFWQKCYDFYSFTMIPQLGQIIADDYASYRYLVESIRKHPNQEVLKSLLEQVGFVDVCYHNLMKGLVALHLAKKKH